MTPEQRAQALENLRKGREAGHKQAAERKAAKAEPKPEPEKVEPPVFL